MSLIGQVSNLRYDLTKTNWHGKNLELLDLDWRPKFKIDLIEKQRIGLWRYRNFLPIESDLSIISFGEGQTPIYNLKIDNLKVGIKQDFLFPTGSYKDRGACVLLSKIKELGIKNIVQDSSGNAACSIAAYSAAAGVSCEIFVPAATSAAKIAQIMAYGAKINKVEGSRQDTANKALEAAHSSYYASHCWNPYFFQGTKTFAYEIAEQMNWNVPDTIILPVGNGSLLIGAFIGFTDMAESGIISKIPKIIAVQSALCNPLELALSNPEMKFESIGNNQTLAEGIAIETPVRKKQILDIIRRTNGNIISVSELEIKYAWKEMAKLGFFIEPTSAAAIAGIYKYKKEFLQSEEKIVSVFTGTGLKSVDKWMKVFS